MAHAGRDSSRLSLCGNSMMRRRIGSLAPPGETKRMLPSPIKDFGTASDSTTLVHTTGLIEAKVFGGRFHSSSVSTLPKLFMMERPGSELGPRTIPKLRQLFDDVARRKTGNIRRFRMAASARQNDIARSHARWLLAMRNELRHRRMLFGIPIGRVEDIVDLFEGIGPGAARDVPRLAIIRRRLISRCGRRNAQSGGASAAMAAAGSKRSKNAKDDLRIQDPLIRRTRIGATE